MGVRRVSSPARPEIKDGLDEFLVFSDLDNTLTSSTYESFPLPPPHSLDK